MDRYTEFAQSNAGQRIIGALNLPSPPRLERDPTNAAQPLSGLVTIGGMKNGAVLKAAVAVAEACGGKLRSAPNTYGAQAVNGAAGKSVTGLSPDENGEKTKALIFDASEFTDTSDLRGLYDFFNPLMRRVARNGRIVIIGRPPEDAGNSSARAAQRALEGFSRSVAKELGKKGTICQLLYVAKGAEGELEGPLRFFLSPRSAYVSGQVLRITKGKKSAGKVDWNKPLAGKTALVTGAARGIGKSIAQTLARDGATVMVLDIPPAKEDLDKVAAEIGGVALTEDITDADAPPTIAKALQANFGGVDIIVHNAGVTRDKTLARMKPQLWDMVMNINLMSIERINEHLLANNVINANGRILGVASISGIAGNMGQTNYGASKAGVIGYVNATAVETASKGITVNAVAPGFIETQMTAQIPFGIREAGRRLNSLSQGGLPRDVAEVISFFSGPASGGVTGQVLRCCGQSLIGA